MRHLKPAENLVELLVIVRLFANMSNSLFTQELIKTTLAKAKELRRIANQ